MLHLKGDKKLRKYIKKKAIILERRLRKYARKETKKDNKKVHQKETKKVL